MTINDTLHLLYTTIQLKTNPEGKQSFVLINPRSGKSISLFRSGMARLIEEIYRAKEELGKPHQGDGVVYHGVVGAYRNYVYGITGSIYEKRKFIWCRLYVKDDPQQVISEMMMDTNKKGVFVEAFEAYATRIGVMISVHDPLDKILEMVLTIPLETAPVTAEHDKTSPSAPGFIRSELNEAGLI
jgi:hypothetical protein